MPDLFEIISRGRLGELRDALDEGADPEAFNDRGNTLAAALALGDHELALMLIERGVGNDITRCNFVDLALHLCGRYSAVDAASRLLDQGASLDAPNTNNETPLHVAASSRRGAGAVALFLERGADPNTKRYDHFTPLHAAAQMGTARSVRFLLKAGADTNARSFTRYPPQGTPLHHAMVRDDEEAAQIVAALVAAGADIDLRDRTGRTPLHAGADVQKSKGLKALAERTYAIDVRDKEQRTALHRATSRAFVENMNVLIAAGADPEQLMEGPKWRTLHLAATLDSDGPATTLIEAGADLNAPARDASTPLHLAVRNLKLEPIDALIKAGAELDAVDKRGATPLMLAVLKKSKTVVQKLIHHGADPDIAVTAEFKVGDTEIAEGDTPRSIASEALADLMKP